MSAVRRSATVGTAGARELLARVNAPFPNLPIRSAMLLILAAQKKTYNNAGLRAITRIFRRTAKYLPERSVASALPARELECLKSAGELF